MDKTIAYYVKYSYLISKKHFNLICAAQLKKFLILFNSVLHFLFFFRVSPHIPFDHMLFFISNFMPCSTIIGQFFACRFTDFYPLA